MPLVLPLAVTPHTVKGVTREAHGLFLATLATGVVWRVSRSELLTMDQGPAKLITLELREAQLHGSGQGALLPRLEEVVKQQRIADNTRAAETAFDDKESTCLIDEFVYYAPGC